MKRYAQALRTEGLSRRIGIFALLMFLLGLSMSIFAIATAFKVRQEVATSFADLREIRDLQDHASSVVSGLVDAETGYRGFAYSRDATMLGSLEAAVKAVSRDLAALRALVAGEQAFEGITERLSVESSRTLDAIGGEMEALKADRLERSAVIAGLIRVKDNLDTARATNAEFQAALSKLLVQRRLAISGIISTLLTTVALLIVGVGLVAFVLGRELAARTVDFVKKQHASQVEIDTLSESVSRSRGELEEVNLRLTLALHAARVQVFALDAQSRIEWITDREGGITTGVVSPVTLASLADPADMAATALAISTCLETGEPANFELRVPQPDGALNWFLINIAPQERAASGVVLGSAVDVTELKSREISNFWLMRELSHRSKNLLAIVQAMARQTARTTTSTQEFQSRFSARLRALAAAHDLLVKTSYTGAELMDLLRTQFGALEGMIGSRILLAGPGVRLRPEAAQNLGMALHELATNAQIHGALSVPEGIVNVNWSIEGAGERANLILYWIETGGPVPKVEGQTGFGTTLIATNLPRSLEGEVVLTHEATGTRCHIELPMRRIREELAPAPSAS